jgi:hypothetical protein
MRKRSKYRPREIRDDPVAYVMNGFLPLTTAKSTITLLLIKNHGALEQITKGHGTRADAIMLSHAMTTTASLAEIGTGNDWLAEIEQGTQAVNAMLLRGEIRGHYGFTGPEMTAINIAMEVHDAQIEGCTVARYEAAIKRARLAIQCGHTRSKVKTPRVDAP